MVQLAPTASGTLHATPLAHLLVYALGRKLGGTFVLEEPSHAKHAIYLLDGAPVRARGTGAIAPLGELAVEQGLLSTERLAAALETSRATPCHLGQTLLESGALDEAGLERLLREQVARRIEAFARLPPETLYGYYAGVNFLENAGGPSTPSAPLPLIWRAVRASVFGQRVRDLLDRLGTGPVRFRADAPLAHFEFSGSDRAVVDVLSAKPQSLAELQARALASPERVEQLVYTFVLLKHLDLGSGARSLAPSLSGEGSDAPRPVFASSPGLGSPPPSAASPPSPRAASPAASPAPRSPSPSGSPAVSAPTSRSPISAPSSSPARQPLSSSPALSEDAFRRELLERAQAGSQSYYEVLGVAQTAAAPEIAAQYFQLAKRWHPDRLSRKDEDLRDAAERVFARISEAHQVLSDAERRAEYDEVLKAGGGAAEEQEQIQRMVRAATNFQKAQVLLRRNNHAAAEEAARAALADAPEESDHIALVAWLEANKTGADLEAALASIDRAARAEEANLRVRWYRGQLLKRLGRDRQAIEDFRFIAQRDARHVDAQREIRLYEMQRTRRPSQAPDDSAKARSSHPPTAPKSGGLFGKLFKK